jgi:YD repeat-containing protein
MRRPVLWLLVASGCLKLAYVFLLTDYPHYLFSDFQGYWDRARERIDGNEFSYSQWALWPALPHILLSWYLRAVDLAGLSALRLEAVLAANVLLSTGGVALVFGIAQQTLRHDRWAFAVAALYAFTFPLVYLNAFVMSEHVAVLCVLGAMWIVLRYRRNGRALAGAGAFLGLAVGLRPALGMLGLPFAAYVAAADWFDRRAVVRAALFAAGFFAVVGGVVFENYRISQGQLVGLAANGGVNFYFAQCRTHEVISRHNGYLYRLVSPTTVEYPENGLLDVQRPFHDQSFFGALGWQCLREQPAFWRGALSRIHGLFFGPFLPAASSARGFDFLMAPFRWFFVFCALSLPLAVFVGRRHGVHAGALALLGGALGVELITVLFFGAEHRYLYPMLAPLYVLCACVVMAVALDWRHMAKFVGLWAAVSISALGIVQATQRHPAPSLISATIGQFPPQSTKWPPPDLDAPDKAFLVDTLRFPDADSLRHPVHGDFGSHARAGLAFRTCMEVSEAGLYELQVVSDDAFELRLGDQPILSVPYRPGYAASRVVQVLNAGEYLYALRYFQAGRRVGVIATWRRVTSPNADYRPAVGLHYIGEAGPQMRFSPPEKCGGRAE